MIIPVQDYGEPWEVRLGTDGDFKTVARKGFSMGQMTELDAVVRSHICVNALKGCPDPEAFVADLKDILERPVATLIERTGPNHTAYSEFDRQGAADVVRGRLAHALAWLREVPK